jgi:hypothetical protein
MSQYASLLAVSFGSLSKQFSVIRVVGFVQSRKHNRLKPENGSLKTKQALKILGSVNGL